MKIEKLVISVADVTDALALGNNSIVSSIFSAAEEVVNQGGQIVIQREYSNADPDTLVVYSTASEVRDWKAKLNESQEKFDREPVV